MNCAVLYFVGLFIVEQKQSVIENCRRSFSHTRQPDCFISGFAFMKVK